MPETDDSDAQHEARRPPHTCQGALVRVTLPEGSPTPAAVVTEPEIGAETPLPDVYPSERPPWGAFAVARAIEAAIPKAACRPGYDGNMFRWRMACTYDPHDSCRTTLEEANQRAERIRAVVTPAVEVHVQDCACRIY